MEFKIGDEVEFVKYDKNEAQRAFERIDGMKIGQKLIITKIDGYGLCVNYKDRCILPYQIRHISKEPKKKPYWIEVFDSDEYFEVVMIAGNNVPVMFSSEYRTKRESTQMAKRLAKNLGLEFRQ